jgi:hypothetical protein
MPDQPITLETAGVKTYSDLYDMPTGKAIKLIDEKNVPLHAGDAFIAVLVLRGVRELGEATERLDAAATRFQIAGIVLAVVAVAVAIAQLIASF